MGNINNVEFPLCCVGRVITGLGGCGYGHRDAARQSFTHAALTSQINGVIKFQKAEGYAFVAATTNTEQALANQVLTELGFQCTPWMKKKKNQKDDVKLWWLPLETDNS